ncbi:MAG: hypothetical protein II864_08985 [Prevotella sp.]|nr:hypothetical protein [Prevotella sp.]
MRRKLLSMLVLLMTAATGAWADVADALGGAFTINSSGDKVRFSKGNLQATTSNGGSTWTWAFATNQWDCIGNATANTTINGNGSVSTVDNATVDLFGWSTAKTYFGINNSTTAGDYSGDFVDWGTQMGEGWRTLTNNEWNYLVNTRASGSTVNGTSDGRYTMATINTDDTSVKGVILFPDGVNFANSEATSWGAVNGKSAWATSCTSAQWTALAAKGCVFLPAQGHRTGTTIAQHQTDATVVCYFWSSTVDASNGSKRDGIYFADQHYNIQTYPYDPCTGFPVRLVRDAVTLTDGNDLSGLSAYAGQTVDVTYTRSFTSGKTSTVCLPFAYAKKTGDGSFYAFTNIEKEGNEYVATMTEPAATTLTANTPYLFTPAASSVTFTGTIADVPATFTAGETTSNGWTFKGTYETIEWTDAPTGIYGFSAQDVNEQGISQGQFVKAGEYVRIQPMRCYLENASFAGARGAKREAEPLPETIKVRLVSANGEVTAIGSLLTKTGEVTLDGGTWYSLDGRRIAGKPTVKGVYVNNGKKVIIK